MNADRIAPLYRAIEYAAFGRALEQARFRFVDRLTTARKILILGEGDGRFLARLLNTNPSAQVHVIDLSFEMLRIARHRAGVRPSVHFVQASALNLPLRPQTYDAIVTNFFLDCLSQSQADSLIPRLARALTPRGQWLITEFDVPGSGWRRLNAQLWITTMYRFFQVATALETRRIPTYHPLLQQSGLRAVEFHQSRFGLITSQLWQMS